LTFYYVRRCSNLHHFRLFGPGHFWTAPILERAQIAPILTAKTAPAGKIFLVTRW